MPQSLGGRVTGTAHGVAQDRISSRFSFSPTLTLVWMKPHSFIRIAIALCLVACSQRPILDREPQILDKEEMLDRQDWWDNRDWDWYKAKIPFFESPDPDIDATYYYRWEVVTKHLTYGSPETGYTFTEFIDRPFWSGTYGGISCPLGHQFYEVRWLKDRRIIEDFARYWFETPGAEPRSYSNWYGDAMWATYLVLGDEGVIRTVLPHMERQYQGWIDEHWDAEHRMFRWDGMHDGMETNINSRLTADTFAGAEGYRPTLNSYLYADAQAISRAAALLGDSAKARAFADRAAELKRRVQDELWDPERNFFFHQFAEDELNGVKAKSLTYETGKYAGSPYGRELLGYVPWQFNLPDSGYAAAWQYLMDPDYFFAPFGPTTVERRDPQFLVSPTCCVWSGNQWPYATTQTLVAFANLLNNYEQSVVTKDDYFTLLKTYTLDHRMDGRPYIAEAANPDDGSWDGHNSFYHSEHYLHSAYVDLVITGLVGLRPRADDSLELNPLVPDDWDYFALDGVSYHGHRISIVWDRDGSRYGKGSGLSVLADGRAIANAPTIRRLAAPLGPAMTAEEIDRPTNFAVNNGGAGYPLVTASHSAPTTPPHYAIDGNYWYHASPPNRWTAVGSGGAIDWIAVDFGVGRPIAAVKSYFYDDRAEVLPPASYDVQFWDGEAWINVPRQSRSPREPTGRRANVVSFPEIETSKIRLVLAHQKGASSGVTEIEVWGYANQPLPEPTAAARNIAFNGGDGGFPKASASYTSPRVRLDHLNDMQIAFTRYSRNRWTAHGSPNTHDWVAIDFGEPKIVEVVDLYLYGDGRDVEAPKAYVVQFWEGEQWIEAEVRSRHPSDPTAWAMNRVRIVRVETERIRVVFEHDLPAFTGVTELMLWSRHPGDGR